MKLDRLMSIVAAAVLCAALCASARADASRVAAVLDFGAVSNAMIPDAQALSDLVRAGLSGRDGVELVERDRLAQILRELKLGSAGFLGREELGRIGEMTGAHILVNGRIDGPDTGAVVRILIQHTESGVVMGYRGWPSTDTRSRRRIGAEIADWVYARIRDHDSRAAAYTYIALNEYENNMPFDRLDDLRTEIYRDMKEDISLLPFVRVVEREELDEILQELRRGDFGLVDSGPLRGRAFAGAYIVTGGYSSVSGPRDPEPTVIFRSAIRNAVTSGQTDLEHRAVPSDLPRVIHALMADVIRLIADSEQLRAESVDRQLEYNLYYRRGVELLDRARSSRTDPAKKPDHARAAVQEFQKASYLLPDRGMPKFMEAQAWSELRGSEAMGRIYQEIYTDTFLPFDARKEMFTWMIGNTLTYRFERMSMEEFKDTDPERVLEIESRRRYHQFLRATSDTLQTHLHRQLSAVTLTRRYLFLSQAHQLFYQLGNVIRFKYRDSHGGPYGTWYSVKPSDAIDIQDRLALLLTEYVWTKGNMKMEWRDPPQSAIHLFAMDVHDKYFASPDSSYTGMSGMNLRPGYQLQGMNTADYFEKLDRIADEYAGYLIGYYGFPVSRESVAKVDAMLKNLIKERDQQQKTYLAKDQELYNKNAPKTYDASTRTRFREKNIVSKYYPNAVFVDGTKLWIAGFFDRFEHRSWQPALLGILRQTASEGMDTKYLSFEKEDQMDDDIAIRWLDVSHNINIDPVDLGSPYPHQAFDHYVYDPNFDQSMATSIVRVGNEIWVGTYGAGIVRYSLNGWENGRIQMRHGLPTHYVYTLLPDGGLVWIGLAKGKTGGLAQMDLKTRKITLLADEYRPTTLPRAPRNAVISLAVAGG